MAKKNISQPPYFAASAIPVFVNFSIKEGITGIIIPTPITSISTVTKIKPNRALNRLFISYLKERKSIFFYVYLFNLFTKSNIFIKNLCIMDNPLLKPFDNPFGSIPFEEIKLEHYKPAVEI